MGAHSGRAGAAVQMSAGSGYGELQQFDEDERQQVDEDVLAEPFVSR